MGTPLEAPGECGQPGGTRDSHGTSHVHLVSIGHKTVLKGIGLLMANLDISGSNSSREVRHICRKGCVVLWNALIWSPF